MEETIIQETNQTQNYQLEFFGKGSDYFSIIIVNWLLTIVTLGLYYPWARAKNLRFMYGNTSLNNERFHFAGTGKEMFRGFIFVILFYFAVLGIYTLFITTLELPLLGILFLYLALLAIIPFAIHGSLRYRMSRTSYRGVRFGYRGSRNELVKEFFKGVLLTILSLGIYGAWLQMNIRRYTHKNIRYGDVEFSNNASGSDWFVINLKGYILSVFTIGIYSFWWQSEIFAYYFDRLRMTKGEQKIKITSTASGGDFFELLMINFLIVVFTLGFGKAWADVRTQKFMCDKLTIKGDIDLNEIYQTEEEYKNAFGEDAMDFFDIDLA